MPENVNRRRVVAQGAILATNVVENDEAEHWIFDHAAVDGLVTTLVGVQRQLIFMHEAERIRELQAEPLDQLLIVRFFGQRDRFEDGRTRLFGPPQLEIAVSLAPE